MSECPTCGKTFSSDEGVGKHHSRMHPDSWEDMFWYYVDEDAKNGCWEWRGRTANDYGSFKRDGVSYYTHRLSYRMRHGVIPKPQVNHHCDNRTCVNPDHLYSGTQRENMQDAYARNPNTRKGLIPYQGQPFPHPKGEKCHKSKLDREGVVRIKERLNEGEQPHEIAEDYPVHRDTISKINTGVNWSHIQIDG